MSNLITITTQPVGKNIFKNSTDTFTVAATAQSSTTVDGINYNFTSIRYEWYKNNVIVPAPFGRESIFTPLPISANSSYYVNVIAKYTHPLNPLLFNEVTLKSNVVALTIIDKPELAEEQPGLALKQIAEGTSASLSIALKPSPNLTQFYCQWYEGASGLETNPIENATNLFYTTPSLASTKTYWVKVYNLYNDFANSINSPSVRVEVLSSQESTRQANINKINNLTGGTNGDKLVDLDFKQISSDFADEAVQIEAQKLLAAFPSLPNMPGAGAAVYVTKVLNDFDESQIRIVSQAQSLADCAKDIPQRLINIGIGIAKRLLLNLISNITGIAFADLIALAKALEKIIEIADQFILNVVSAAVGAVAEVVAQATTAATNALGALNDICNSFPYNTENGNVLLRPTNIPTGNPPTSVMGVVNPVQNMSYNLQPKNEYDSFIFQLKEPLEKDPQRIAALAGTNLQNYIRMLAVLNTLAYSYHDNISRTADDSKDLEYKATYLQLVADELSKHPEWDAATKLDYSGRANVIENEITRNVNVIRAYYSRNAAATGDWIPMYMTAYGSAAIDATTAIDQEKANRGVKGYEGFSQTKGAYGALVQGTSVASNYWKGKTVLEIRYANDKSPVGVGHVTVHDTGGMSNNVIDYYCGDDKKLYNSILSKGTNNGGKTKPQYATPIEVRVVSGAPKEGKTL
jgi:hypothetical protein